MCEEILKKLGRARSYKSIRRICKRLSDDDVKAIMKLCKEINEMYALPKKMKRSVKHFINPRFSISSKRRYMWQRGGAGGAAIRALGKIFQKSANKIIDIAVKGSKAVKPVATQVVGRIGKVADSATAALTTAGKQLTPSVTAASRGLGTVRVLPKGTWHAASTSNKYKSEALRMAKRHFLPQEGIISSGINTVVDTLSIPAVDRAVMQPIAKWWGKLVSSAPASSHVSGPPKWRGGWWR